MPLNSTVSTTDPYLGKRFVYNQFMLRGILKGKHMILPYAHVQYMPHATLLFMLYTYNIAARHWDIIAICRVVPQLTHLTVLSIELDSKKKF